MRPLLPVAGGRWLCCCSGVVPSLVTSSACWPCRVAKALDSLSWSACRVACFSAWSAITVPASSNASSTAENRASSPLALPLNFSVTLLTEAMNLVTSPASSGLSSSNSSVTSMASENRASAWLLRPARGAGLGVLHREGQDVGAQAGGAVGDGQAGEVGLAGVGELGVHLDGGVDLLLGLVMATS